METPITYIPGFVPNAGDVFTTLWNELDWERRPNTPRREYYINDFDLPYTYGRDEFARTYLAKPMHPAIAEIRRRLEAMTNCVFEVCFLNGYEDQSDSLYWHADDSESMDDDRPIAIVSLGVAREIWFAPKDDMKAVHKRLLEAGSLCLMAPGMQDTHKHRIPKAHFMCGARVSLTFRGYVKS